MDYQHFFEIDLNQRLRSHPDVLSDVNAVYQFELEDQIWHIDLRGERQIKPGAHPEPDCTIQTQAETFQKILDNKAALVLALLTGKIKILGKKKLSIHLQEFFK